jgi:hypothetical protein
MALSTLTSNIAGTEFISGNATSIDANSRKVDFYKNGSSLYFLTVAASGNRILFYKETIPLSGSFGAATATFSMPNGGSPQDVKFVFNGANSYFITCTLFAGTNFLYLFRFDPETVSGTISTATASFTVGSNPSSVQISVDGTTGYLSCANNGANTVSFWKVASIASVASTNIAPTATFATSAGPTDHRLIIHNASTCFIFSNNITANDVTLYKFDHTSVSSTNIAATATYNSTAIGTTFQQFMSVEVDSGNYYMTVTAFGNLCFRRISPNSDTGIISSLPGGVWGFPNASFRQTAFYFNGANSHVFATDQTGNQVVDFQVNPATVTSASSKMVLKSLTSSTSPIKLIQESGVFYLAVVGTGTSRLDYWEGITFDERSLGITDNLVLSDDDVYKPSGGAVTITKTLTGRLLGNAFRYGAAATASGLSGKVYGWNITFGSEDDIYTVNEDVIFTGGSTISAGATYTVGSGKSVQLGSAGTYSISTMTFASGTKLKITQNTVVGSGVVLQAGSIVESVGGAFSLTIPYADPGITLAGGATLITPQVLVIATNFADGVRVQISHRQIFTIASTAINATTDVITLGNDSNGDAANFRTTSPNTLIRFALTSGATIPASTPQIIDGGLYYWKSGGQLSITEGGTAINFTSQGSGNFVLIAETEISNTAVSGGSGLSVALTRSANAAIRVKASHFSVDGSGNASCSKFFDQVFAWSATSGITIPDVVNNTIAVSQDSIHEQIVALSEILLGGSIQSASGTFINSISPADSGQSVSGLSLALEGVGRIQMNANDADGILAWQDLYLWGCYVRATEAGIRLASANTFIASDIFNFVFENLEFDNTGSVPLAIVGGVGRSADGTSVIASGSGSIALNALSQGTGAISSSSGGGGATAADIWAHGTRTITGTTASAITAASIATDAIDADALATDAITEIWSAGTRTLTAGTNIALAKGSGVTGFNDITAADVWAAVTRSLTDKTGYSLSASQSFSLTGNITGNLSGSVGSVASAVTLPNAPTDWITAASLSSGAVAEIQSGLATSTALGTLPTLPQIEASTVLFKVGDYTAPPTVSQIWGTATSGLTGVGTIGKLLSDNINATISSRSTYAGGDTAGTTDLLTRLTLTRAGYLDNLNYTYVAPDNDAIGQIGTRTLRVDGLIVNPGGGDRFTATALINAPTSGSAPSAADIWSYTGGSGRTITGLANNAITAAAIQDGALTTAKFGTGAILTPQMVANALNSLAPNDTTVEGSVMDYLFGLDGKVSGL